MKMNLSWNNFTRHAAAATPSLSREIVERTALLRFLLPAVYCVISSVALFGNTLVILVFVFDRRLLRKSYNILILTLAVSDVLSATSVIITQITLIFFHPTNHVSGEIFCRIILTYLIPWQLLFFSVYICLLLSVERWIAVVKPYKYRSLLSRKKVACCIFASWVWSFVLNCTAIFDMEYKPSSDYPCVINISGEGSSARLLVGVFQVMMMVFFPCVVMIGLYIHMIVSVNSSAVASEASKVKLRGKMTRMIAITCFMLIILYTPSRIFLFLAFAGKANLFSVENNVLALLTFVTNCVNPFVFGLSNIKFRQRYKNVYRALCSANG